MSDDPEDTKKTKKRKKNNVTVVDFVPNNDDPQKTTKGNRLPKLEQGEIFYGLLKYISRVSNDMKESDLSIGLFCLPTHKILKIGIYLAKENSSEYKILAYNTEKTLAEELTVDGLIGKVERRLAVFSRYPETLTAKYCLAPNQAVQLVQKLLRSKLMRITDWPMPLGFKSSPGCFFYRRPFDPFMNATIKDFPFIYSYLKRTKNWKSLCKIIGSVLAGKPLRKYSPLLFGDPGSGKSTFYRLLKNIFGDDAVGIVPKTYKDTVFGTFVEDTAAWFADDCDPGFLATELYKELSGSDSFAIRKMHKDYYKVPLRGVFFFNLNSKKLILPNDSAVVQKRIIPCEVITSQDWKDTTEIKDDEIVDALAAKDYPAFSGYCIKAFESMDGGALKYDMGDIEDYVVDIARDDLGVIFDVYYEFIEFWDVPGVGDKPPEKPQVTVKAFTSQWEIIAKTFPVATYGKTSHDLRAWIVEKLGIKDKDLKTKNCKIGGKSVKCIQGIRVKPGKKFN